MTNPIWRDGPPPSLGWWPASVGQIPGIYRWWNGAKWSAPAIKQESAFIAGKAASKPVWSNDIQWHVRPTNWPARSMT